MPSYPNLLSNIELQRSVTADTESSRTDTQSHFIEITAVPAQEGDDPAIFVHHLDTLDATQTPPLESATLDRVCSPADYNELPVGPPTGSQAYTEFRTDKIKHFGRSMLEIEALWDFVNQDVQELLDAFNRAGELDDDSVTLGAE